MMPKASLNCWIAEWEKESKMFAFLGMMRLGIEGPVLQQQQHFYSSMVQTRAHSLKRHMEEML
jgi:hypothetical protein